MFKEDKVDKKFLKERAKIRKKALKEQQKYDRRRKEAEKIKDEKYVQERLAIEKMKDEELLRKRDKIVQENLADVLSEDITSFKCKFCGADVSLSNLTCPNCGQLYCQYCGAPMDMENPSQCPRCGGVPFYQPAELVLTRVEDIPPEERFWEQLPTCPKCGATVQPDWDECPICGVKLTPKAVSSSTEVDTGVWTEEDLAKASVESKPESPKEYKKRRRREAAKKGKKGI